MSVLDPNELIASGGLALIAFIVFAESGLLFGFFFPGDTLLFAAGILAAGGEFNIIALILIIMVSAILGGQSGYYIGKRAGPRLFRKKDGIVFRQEYIDKSEKFYEKHGGKTIILARFIPVVRTFAPVVAGIGSMSYARFTAYNVIGGVLWATSVTLLGYYFGQQIPNVDAYILPIIALAMIASIAPTIYHILKDPKSRQKLAQKFKAKKD
ncbi:MAG TPA: VTT domain-containing protein [Patescibacteria group bacterium]|nr:VTT domain-containing protein [Patescibacteria group bacterium]